ncbi:MAG TPA: hypothetical protein VLN58_08245 [Verrucomicrobiae bacterium]|nr:hypothetical protein [Verrucomicrobiae bacterium]
MRIHTTVRKQAPTEELELRDLLDRILDKGIFLGSTNMLLLGETDLAASQKRFSVSSPSPSHGWTEHAEKTSVVRRRK